MTLDNLIEELTRLEKEATPGPWHGRLLLEITESDSDLCDYLRNHLPAILSALKENKRLREPLSDAAEAIIMMSGSSDFALDGQAGAWWAQFRDETFFPTILPLTTNAALQPQGEK